MILFDTSVLSRVFRRQQHGSAERQLVATFETLMSSDAALGMPGIVLQEVLSGLRTDRQFRELQAKLLGAFTIVVPSIEDHVDAARLRNACAAKGVNVSGIDCLVAAATMAGGHELFTADADFEAIARLVPLRLYRPA